MTRHFGKVAVVLVLVFALAASTPVAAEVMERDDLGFYSLVDRDGAEILLTGLLVSLGDLFISEDNKEYRVAAIEGDRAIVDFIRDVDLGAEAGLPEPVTDMEAADTPSWWQRLVAWLPLASSTRGNPRNATIAIYHTHSDESYVPTDGTASIEGHGGIYKVGDALAAELEKLGFRVDHDKTSHDPHDANAYNRSRRTARRVLGDKPALTIDLHRDTAPAATYRRQIAGETVTQLMLVVGRQNPKEPQNDGLAKKIKAVVDKKYPGLIRGIFYGKGDYNQDLSGRMMLIEVGSYRNKRQYAEAGAALFGEAMPAIISALGGAGGTVNRTSGRAWLWLVVLVLVGGIGYLLVSTGSWREAVAKVRGLGSREWGDVFRRSARSSGDTSGPRSPGPEDPPPPGGSDSDADKS